MAIIRLDLSDLAPDQQVDGLKAQYLRLRGTGSEVRVLARCRRISRSAPPASWPLLAVKSRTKWR